MRRPVSLPATVFALAASVLTPPPAAPAEDAPVKPAPVLERCRLEGLDEELRCGTYEVFEDRAAGSGRTIPLRVVVMPATGGKAERDPIVFFAGGPGGSSVDSGKFIGISMAEARERRDILLVDYRGSGESSPLFCPYQHEERGVDEALNTFLPIDLLADCREHLSKHADLRFYTTANIVDDVEEVRRALGYGKVNLVGGSYGTRAALVYLRRHPDSVRSAVLEGVTTLDGAMPSTFARDTQTALDQLFAECAADPVCQTAFPDPAADLAAVLERARSEAPRVEITLPESGAKRTVTMTEAAVIQTVRYQQYQALQSLQLPAFLRAAADGDWTPLAQAAYNVALNILVAIPDGLYLSVTCSEDVPFIDTEAAVRDAAGTYMGTFRLRSQQQACAEWVRGPIPEGFRRPVVSDTPVLIVSGERDPVTPARWGTEAGTHLANSRHLVIPDGAHGSFGLRGLECVDRLTVRFIDQAGWGGIDIETCRASIERPSFLLSAARPEAIELPAEALPRFAGAYAAPEGAFAATVVLADGALRLKIFEDDLALVPVAPLRFVVEGAPPGTFIEFSENDGAIVAVELFQAGSSIAVLARKAP